MSRSSDGDVDMESPEPVNRPGPAASDVELAELMDSPGVHLATRRRRRDALRPQADAFALETGYDSTMELMPHTLKSPASVTDELETLQALGGASQSAASIGVHASDDLQVSYVLLYLLLLGVLMGLVAVVIDVVVLYMRRVHLDLIRVDSFGWSYFLYVVWSIAFTMLAVLVTRLIAPAAVGSGLPEMKSILSGGRILNFLNARMWVAKFAGLLLMLCGGVYAGKEGPFVHISCVTAEALNKLPRFVVIREDPGLRLQLLSVACAVGVAANFGTPFGAVLFAIEVTSAYFPLREYWYSFVGVLPAIILVRLMIGLVIETDLQPFSFPTFYQVGIPLREGNVDPWDILGCCLLFLICGVASAGYVQLIRYLGRFYRRLNEYRVGFILLNCWSFAFLLGLVSGLLGFPLAIGRFMGMGPVSVFETIVQVHPEPSAGWSDGSSASYIGNLIIFIVVKTAVLPLAGLLSAPTGTYIPLLAIGGAFGRLLGELLYLIKPSDAGSLSPAAYAIVGAASLTGGITHTISTAMIMLELLGQLDLVLPVFAGVLISIGICKMLLGFGLYDAAARDRNLPYIPDLAYNTYSVRAGDLMEEAPSIPLKPTLGELMSCLKAIDAAIEGHDPSMLQTFGLHVVPVVKSANNKLLVGAVPVSFLRRLYSQHTRDAYDLLGSTQPDMMRRESLFGDNNILQQARLTTQSVSFQKKPSADALQMALGGASAGRSAGPAGPIDASRSVGTLPVKSLPIRLMETTTVHRVHLLFVTMHLQVAFVCSDDGILVGKVTRDTVAHIDQNVPSPFTMKQLIAACCTRSSF